MKWFKHDSDAHTDAKLKKLKHKFGITGYGLYWYCLELIVKRIELSNLTFELEEDAELIALEWGLDDRDVEQIMRYMVDLGLFEFDQNRAITCLKLANRIDKSMTSNPKMRQIIDSLQSKTVMTNHDSVMTVSCEPMQDKIRLDKIRLDKNNKHCAHSAECFERVWQEYPTKVGKKKAKSLFLNYVKNKKLQDSVHHFEQDLINDIRGRIGAGQFGFDKLHFSTYINQERFNDPIEKKLNSTEKRQQHNRDVINDLIHD